MARTAYGDFHNVAAKRRKRFGKKCLLLKALLYDWSESTAAFLSGVCLAGAVTITYSDGQGTLNKMQCVLFQGKKLFENLRYSVVLPSRIWSSGSSSDPS